MIKVAGILNGLHSIHRYFTSNENDTLIGLECVAGEAHFTVRIMVGKKANIKGYNITQRLVDPANNIAGKIGFKNIAFKQANIKNIPLYKNADCMISKGVFSLLTDLTKVFKEVQRILKQRSTFCMAVIN